MKRRATPTDAELGARLRAFRKSAGLNQEKLGRAVGVTFQQIQKYETGANRITASTLIDLAHALDVDILRFVEGLKPRSRKPKPEAHRKGHAIPMKQRPPEDRAKAKQAKIAGAKPKGKTTS